jgi:membrane associated rhomboid family serine protease
MSINDEAKRFRYSLILPFFFILTLWVIEAIDVVEYDTLYRFGVFPRRWEGLAGILFSPLIHSDFNHLVSNSIPLLVLGTGIIYFYRSLAYKVIAFVWLLSGLCVWIGARASYHIGASGLIYGIAAFLFFSGLIRKDVRLMAISLLVIFLYGGLIWGVFPLFPGVSWEYHLFGGICGFIASIIYRKEGPPVRKWIWEEDEIAEGNESVTNEE